MKKPCLVFLPLFLVACLLHAQDTLPKFSVRNAGNNRIIISWNNNFKNIKQLSIQRSFDSLNNYKTILTVPDPTTPQNGYLDSKATNDHMFYRLYILLDKGMYIFSDTKRPFVDTSKRSQPTLTKEQPAINEQQIMVDTMGKLVRIKIGDKFEVIPAKDTAGALDINLKNKIKPDAFTPSPYVSTFKNGYVHVSLPEEEKKYNIKFFEDDGTFLFELKDIKEKSFSIDKSNFYHAGWFRFELYGDGKLIEKHKFYLEREF